MASGDHSGNTSPPAGAKPAGAAHSAPDWAGGLKQLYDAVVEEPLPDAFKDLLDKLDDGSIPMGRTDSGSDGASGQAR